VNLGSIAAALVVVGVGAQILVPGSELYHRGWYNVLLAALAIWGVAHVRRAPVAAFGLGIIALAGIANGLLGPDTRSVIGAPGASVRVDETGGSIIFPIAQDAAPAMLERGASAVPIGSQRYTRDVVLRSFARTVVAIGARDMRGAHLTVTQPTGSAFLSPVLLMQNQQNIDGLILPYDTFALPSAHRIVTAVLFSAAQAASTPALAAMHGPVVLFEVEDDSGASIPHGIGVAPSGGSVRLGGVALSPTVFSYPAIAVISIPNIPVCAIGLAALALGLLFRTRWRW
jgi:hypothetical protein